MMVVMALMMIVMVLMMMLVNYTCKTWSELSFEDGGISGAPCLLSQHLDKNNCDEYL